MLEQPIKISIFAFDFYLERRNEAGKPGPGHRQYIGGILAEAEPHPDTYQPHDHGVQDHEGDDEYPFIGLVEYF